MQHRLTHYFIGLYLTLCSLGQVQATTDPFEELVKTTTQRLNAQIKQNALNERRNQAHLNQYILYLGGKDWKNNNTDTSWVRDDTDETILESQLKALDRQAKEGMFAQPYKDAGFHMVYIGDYTIHLNSLVSVEDLASLRTLDKLKDPKKVEAQHLARVNQNILSTIAKIKEGIEWTSFNRTNKMLYIYLRIRFVYSDSNYKTIAYRQLTGERSLGGKAQAYISEATRGNMYDLPIIYLKNKVPKLRDAIKEVMDGRAEIKEETPILASFDMNWNTSTSTSIDAQLLSGVGTVDEMTSQHAQNAQIEFMDYTGHYQANSAEQKNLRLFLNFDQQEPLAAYRLAKKIIIRVTNQNTPKEIRHAIAQFELPANAVLIWLDFDASKQSFNTRIRYGEGLRSQYLADQNAADRYLQAYFEAVMVKAIDANEWVNGKNAMRFLAFLTDNLGYIIKQTQLPEAAWNPEKSPCLLALPEDIRLRWALVAGVYNGAIQELSGVPDLVGLIAKYFYDPQVYTQINGMLAELSISGLVQSMGKAAVAHAALYKDPNIYKVHHQAGKDIFGIVSFLAPILKAGKVKNLADLRLVLLRMVDFRPSAQWLLQVAKKSALTLKQEGQKLLIYADRQATRLLASIENGMIRLEQTLDELSGGRLLGSFDEAQVITPDGRTITTKVELWEKDDKVYMKGDEKGGSGGLDWARFADLFKNKETLAKIGKLSKDEADILFKDLADNSDLVKAMDLDEGMVDGWKKMYDLRLDNAIRQSPIYCDVVIELVRIKLKKDKVKADRSIIKLLKNLNNIGAEGTNLGLMIAKKEYISVQGYDDLIKKAAIDLQSVKSINQALNKANELVSKGISKNNLRFEHDLNNGFHDVDLGIKDPVIPDAYIDAYQFKGVEGKLNNEKIRIAARQLTDVSAKKKILELKCNSRITEKDIDVEKVIEEMRFQSNLTTRGTGAGIHEYHFRLSDGRTIIRTIEDLK